MDSRWLNGHKDKEARKQQVRGYERAFADLSAILEKELKKKPCRDYDNTSWATKQIATNEYNAALEDLMKLIKVTD